MVLQQKMDFCATSMSTSKYLILILNMDVLDETMDCNLFFKLTIFSSRL